MYKCAISMSKHIVLLSGICRFSYALLILHLHPCLVVETLSLGFLFQFLAVQKQNKNSDGPELHKMSPHI